LRAAGLRRLIVGPGCVLLQDTPDANLQKVVDTVGSVDPWSKEWEAYE